MAVTNQIRIELPMESFMIFYFKMGGECGDLAVILQQILQVKGYQARTVQLMRQIGSAYDTHVVTEVWDKVQQKFIMLDPTFGLMIRGENGFLNAMEIRNGYLYKKYEMKQMYTGTDNGKFLKEYYVNYFPLYNNVLLVDNKELMGIKEQLARLPFFQYFLAMKYYVFDDSKDKSLTGTRQLYLLFYFYTPILIFSLFLLLFFSFLYNRFSRKQGDF